MVPWWCLALGDRALDHKKDNATMTTDDHPEPRPAFTSGIDLLLMRGWGQEVIHQLVLRELFAETDLANRLELWSRPTHPRVVYEPLRGLFDLALADGRDLRVLIELKAATEVGENQRGRQLANAAEAGATRVYILLGVGFWAITKEPGVRYIGLPELGEAVAAVAQGQMGALGELARAYAARLRMATDLWVRPLDRANSDPTNMLRFYEGIAAAWPVTTRPYRATNQSGPEWILNADAWTSPPLPGWEPGRLYWELVNGRVRFKVEWRGERELRMSARNDFRRALEAAAAELGTPVRATRAKSGHWMTAAELPEDAYDLVVDGQVDPARARRLYDRATELFDAAVARLGPLDED